MPKYITTDGRTFDVPESEKNGFELAFPDAKVEYENNGEVFHVPISDIDGFLEEAPNATFSKPKENPVVEGVPAVPMAENVSVAPTPSEKPKESPFGINANIPTVAETARGMVNGVNVNSFASLPNQPIKPITEFGEGVKEGGKQLVAGAEYAAGETLRPIVGTSEDDKAALERIESLEKEGKDVAKNVQSTATISPAMALGLKVFGPKGSSAFVRTMEKTAEANIAAQKALKEADGNVEQAKAILEEKANKKTLADTMRKDAERKMAEARPTKGWGWVGSMIPQMVGTGVGLGMTAVTKNPMWAQAIGIGNMAGLTTSAAGSAMAEARQAGASNAEVWTAGLLNGVIENVSERFALGKYTKGLFNAAKKSGSQAAKEAVAEVGSPARKELAKLLDKANKQLDGKLLSGKNVEDYIVQVWDETLSEGAAEALQTVAPMLYQNPDDYPNLWGIVKDVANNTLEGMKGGLFMGSILGGLSKSAEHRMNRARRKAQGFVDVAEVINPNGTRTVVEVVKDDNGEDAYVEDGKYIPLKSQEIGRREQFKFADFERGQFQNEQDESYDIGKTLETSQELKDAKNMLEKTAAVVRERNGLGEDGDVDAFLGENPLEKAAKIYDEDEEVGRGLLDYINAKATLDGIIDKAKGQIKTEVEQAEAMIDSRKSLSDGMIHPAVMKTNDRQVYVINGNVERFDDGNVDTQKSSDSIIVMDATTGKKEFVSPKDLLSIDVAIDPEVEKKAVRTTIGERIATDVENKLNGVLAFNPNDTYEVLNPQGERTTVQVVSDNGDGTINVIMGDAAEPIKVTKNAVQTMADNLNSQRADEMLQGRNEMLQSEKLQKEAEQMVVPTATETPAEVAPAPRVVPTTKDGKPDFNAMDAEMFVEEYASRYGEENTAKIARKNIAVEREKIAKLDKKIDDVTDPNQIDALYEQRQASEAVVNRYNDILERLGLSEDANETEADQKSRLRNEANNRIASLFPDGMPNVESFILADIATGNRLRWSDKETNGVVTSRGLGAELGLSDTERRRRLPLIGKDAMTPEEYAETLRERLDAVGIRYDESSLRDAVLDVYSSVDSRKGAWDALENMSKKMQEPQADMDWEDMQQQLAYNKAQENVDNTPELPSLDTIEEETPISEGEYAEMEQQAQAEEQADYDAMMEENPPVDARGLEKLKRQAEREDGQFLILPSESTEEVGALSDPTLNISSESKDNAIQNEKQEISQENAEPSVEKATPTISNKEENRRKPPRERANEWAQKVGVSINLVESIDEVDNAGVREAIESGERVTGWTVGGKVYLYMPYISSRTEVDKTYLHEVVAHVGMKELLGKDGYKAFCERVFNEVMTKAQQDYYRAYRGVKNDAQAADEFIAHLAEDVNMDATVWQKIVKIFRDALHNMGIDTRITNADIEAMLRDSYKKLVEENGMAGINEKDETSRFMVTDRNVQNVILKDTEERKLPTTRKEAFEYIPEGGVSFYNKDVDANIKVSRKAVKHTSLHNQQDAYAIFAGMEDIIGNSVKIGNIPVAADEVGHTHSVSVMYVPVNINGTQYSARLIIKELENKGVVLEELSLYNVSMHKEKSSAVQPLNASNEVGGITAKPYSYYKVKDLIHNSQEEDKKILGLNENTRFRVKDDATEAIFATAKEKFGITYDMREAGYILPDGSMLDFSGKHEIRGADTSFLNGQRSVDHRAIQEIAYDFDENETGVETDLGDFLDRGAIRIDYNTGAINLNVAPTKAQKDRLKRLIERNDGDVYIDFGKGWDTEHYVEYESARASRVLADIDRYFNEGIKPSGNIRFRTAESAPVFYSNAEYAVKAVKQDKATPEQWLKMIEKNGGLKAGEDKWLGLSDWLKSSDKKTLTKQEVFDFIKENQIQIEEVVYGDVQDLSAEDIQESDEFAALVDSLTDYEIDENGDEYPYINRDRYQELRNGSWNFSEGFSVDYWGEGLDIDSVEAAAEYLGVSTEDRNINETRLKYTTDGLETKREVALVVPTIESWNAYDDVHFGDAGNGRAIAWVRFGETKVPIEKTIVKRVLLDAPYKDVNGDDVYKIKETRSHFIVNKKLRNGERKFVPYVNDKPIGTTIETAAFDTLEEASKVMQNYYQEHPYKYMENQRVLVIDEVQSKRHQEGREKGYRENYIKNEFDLYLETLTAKYGQNWVFDDLSEADQQKLMSYSNRADVFKEKGIPSAPFEKNWAELAMKRMLRYAAENGFDKVAWTTGEQQAERYDIGNTVDGIDVVPYEAQNASEIDGFDITIRTNNYGERIELFTDRKGEIQSGEIAGSSVAGKHLSDILGKPLANKIISNEGGVITDVEKSDSAKRAEYASAVMQMMSKYNVSRPTDLQRVISENDKATLDALDPSYVVSARTYSGDGLRIGNEGMKAFYDQMIPSFMNKYGKKWGVKVGEVTMPSLEENNTMHSIDVTDAMRESVMQGQPLFRTAKTNYESQFADLQSEYDTLDKNDAEALNEWRDKKADVVRSYISRLSNKFGLKCELYVFNGGREEEMRKAYDTMVEKYKAEGIEKVPSYESFKKKASNPKVVATHRKYINFVTFNTSANDAKLNIEQFAETLFHENAHRIAEKMYSKQEFEQIWENAKKSKNSIAKSVEKLYSDKSDAQKGNEFIAKAIGALVSNHNRLFTNYLMGKDNISAEDLVKKLKYSLPLGKLALTETLNEFKNEYQERVLQGSGSSILGGGRDGGDIEVSERDGGRNRKRDWQGDQKGQRPRRRLDVVGAATDLAESLGVKLNVIEDVTEITDSNTRRQRAKRGAKAWYVVNTDQVYFVAPNATSIEDAQMSVLHEVVAHKGLRDVVGRENFNKFLDKVFYYAEKEIRSRIVRLASQNGWNFRVATEEYLASLAEEGFDSRENRTFLQKVRDFFMDMLREAKIAIGFNISDNDMRYMLWRTYQMQKSQGAMAVAEDVLMQQKMGVGNFRTRTSAQIERDYPNWLDGTTTESGKHSTQVEGTRKTYNKVGDWIEQNMGKDVAILDASSGMGYGTADLRDRGFNIEDVEPYQSEKRKKSNPATYSSYADINKKYDYIISNAVLNVIPDDWRTDVLHNMADLMADGGKMFINTRKAGEEKAVKDKIELDIPQEVLVKRNGRIASYQRFFTPSELKAWVEQELGDGFEVEIANKKNSGTSGLAAVVVTKIGDDVRFRATPKPTTDKARKLYDEAVRKHIKDRNNVGRFENLWHHFRESYQDSMLAVKALYDAVLKETGNKLHDFEDLYKAENRLSSTNKAHIEAWERDYMKPLQKAILSLIKKGTDYNAIIDYLLAKSGLERNEVLAKRDAEQIAKGWEKKRLDGAKRAYNFEQRKVNGSYGGQVATLNKNLGTGAITQEYYDAQIAKLAKQRDNDLATLERKYNRLVLKIQNDMPEMYEKAWSKLRDKDYSGLTELTGEKDAFSNAAQKMVDAFESTHDTTELWKTINAATKATLRKSYDSGMMNKETFEKTAKMFKYYIPLRGWDNNAAADHYEYMANSNMKILPALKTAKGRTSRADDPIATIGSMGESSIIQGNRNLMKLKLLNFAERNHTSLLTVSEQWYVQKADGTWVEDNPVIPENATGDEVDAIVKKHEADMLALGDKASKERNKLNLGLHATTWEGQEHVVRVKRNGKEYQIFVNGNPIAAQAINGFTNPNAKEGWMKRAAQTIKNFMARAFTSLNPAFVITNLSRDLLWAGTTIAIKEDAKYVAQYTKNIASLAWQLPRLISKWQKGTLDMNKPIERYFKEFIENGGETGFTQLNTVDDYKRNMARFIKEAQSGAARMPKKAWRAVWDGVEFLNRSAEDTTRFMTYMTSRQMGRNITDSISDAKDVTVNFNKKGRGEYGATFMNFAYIFFNATIQSLTNFGKLLKHHPKKTTAALTTFASAGLLAPMLSMFVQAMLSDDDDEPTYWDLPEWVRRNNIVLYAPFTKSGYLTVPLPHELRPFYGMGELAFSVLNGKESVEGALAKAVVGFGGLLPFDFTGNGGNMMVNFTPTIAQPIAQLIINQDYFGTPIYRKTAFNELDPEWTKAYKSTNTYLVDATEFLNELTGGDAVEKGWLDINPAKVEHLFESYLGGMGKTLNRTAKTLSMLWDEDMREWRNVPILSNFYQVADERTSGSQINRAYFDAVDEAEDIEHLLSGYKKQAEMGALEYAEKLTNLINSDIYKRYAIVKGKQQAISELNKALRESNDPMNEEQIETQIMNLKVDMLEELEKLEKSESSNK